MKKKEIFTGIGIVLAIYVLLSWIIPAGYYNNGVFAEGAINPVGLLDVITYPLVALTSQAFLLVAVSILVIGGFYGVAKKTGLYDKLVNNVCNYFKNDEELFLMISTFLISLISSLTALTIPLFILVPFMTGVLLSMGYNKFTAFLSGIGGILVGNMANIYALSLVAYIGYFYDVSINANMLFKIILFTLLTGGLILFLLLINKNKKLESLKSETKEKKTKSLTIESSKGKILSSVILIILAIVLILIGMCNWKSSFGITIFDDFDNMISSVKYNNISILRAIIGNINPIGYWTNYELCLILIILSYIIGKIWKLKFSDIVSGFLDGCKELLPTAVMVVFANTILIFVGVNTSSIYATICNYLFTLLENFKLLSVGITTFIGGFLYNDFIYMLTTTGAPIANIVTNLDKALFLQYSIYGLVQFIAPTSVILVAGLTYFDISYKEYLKNIWKPLLIAFIIIVLLTFIMCLI